MSDADKAVASYVANLETLLRTISSMNEEGILNIPNEFMERFSDTIKTLQQLDLNQTENLQQAKGLLLKFNTDCAFLSSHTQLQAAKQNFEKLRPALTGTSEQLSNQHGAPYKSRYAKL